MIHRGAIGRQPGFPLDLQMQKSADLLIEKGLASTIKNFLGGTKGMASYKRVHPIS